MKNNIKAISLSIAVLIVLGGIIIGLQLTKPKEVIDKPEITSEESDEVIMFTDFDIEDVVSIQIVNPNDEYTIIQNKKGEFSIQELDERSEQIPYNQSRLSSIATAIAQFSSYSTVEQNAGDLAKYSLEDNAPQVNAVFKDGSSIVFFIGDYTPLNNNTAYFRLKGSDNIYTFSANVASELLCERHDWLNRQAFPEYDNANAPEINRVTIERKDLDVPMIIEAIPELELEELTSFNSHKLISNPVDIEISPDKSTSVIYGIFGLTASKVLWVAPDEIDYELTQLSDPYCRIEVEVGGEVHTLTIGGEFEGGGDIGVYGVSSYVPELLFLFDTSSLPWLNVTIEDLFSEIFLMPYIYSLERVEVKTADLDTLEFTITGDTESNTVSFNGKPLNANDRDRFGDLYRYLISVRGESLYMQETPNGSELIAKITYHYRDKSRTSNTIEYYTSDNRRSIIRVNGYNIYTCRDVYTTRLLKNVKAFINGEGIMNDW